MIQRSSDSSSNHAPQVHIVRFEEKFRLANGVTLPKIIGCLGSDGVWRKQLVKGNDDLRQDAVMQQFFAFFNCIIGRANATQRSATTLRPVRTYKIVPLSQKSGVLEWCQNTQTLGGKFPSPPKKTRFTN